MRKCTGAISGALALMLASQASAVIIGSPLTIQASSANGVAHHTVLITDGTLDPNGDFTFFSGAPIQLAGVGGTIATFNMLGVIYRDDPQINVFFTMTAGSADATITVSSALLSFAPIAGAEARAGTSFTLSDSGGAAGSLLTGLDGGSAYRAAYNGLIPAGTVFDTQVATFGGGPGGSPNMTENSAPLGAFTPIGLTSSMSSRFMFTLSAGDSASVTNNYEVRIPAPSALVAIPAGVMLVHRRRRSAR